MFEKLGVIADIHGNAWALEAVLPERSGVRGFVNLGDILYGPLQPLETYRISSTNEGSSETSVLSVLSTSP
jgi:hypothetical protein